jgi:hypothetical protein
MLTAKELFSTTPVEIAVEISSRLWKIMALSKFSTFPQGGISLCLWKCGKLEVKSYVKRA